MTRFEQGPKQVPSNEHTYDEAMLPDRQRFLDTVRANTSLDETGEAGSFTVTGASKD